MLVRRHRQPAMIEPQCEHAPRGIGGDRVPAATPCTVACPAPRTWRTSSRRHRPSARSAVESPSARRPSHTATIDGSRPARGTSTTRAGCSPLPRASYGVAFTRTGAPKVAPPSRLTALNTSMPALLLAPQVATTNRSAAASETPSLLRPAIAREVVADCAPARDNASSNGRAPTRRRWQERRMGRDDWWWTREHAAHAADPT